MIRHCGGAAVLFSSLIATFQRRSVLLLVVLLVVWVGVMHGHCHKHNMQNGRVVREKEGAVTKLSQTMELLRTYQQRLLEMHKDRWVLLVGWSRRLALIGSDWL